MTVEEIKQSIVPVNESKMLKLYDEGIPMGDTTYWPELDNHFRFMKQEVTGLLGVGNHGKTAFLFDLMLVKSFFDGTKWIVSSPENYPEYHFYNEIIEKLLGQNVNKNYKTKQGIASRDKYQRAVRWMYKHFWYVDLKEKSQDNFNEVAKYCIHEHGFEGKWFDPWNKVIHKKGSLRDDEYVAAFLDKEKEFAKDHDVFNFWTIHPNSSIQEGKRPTAYNCAGGIMWLNGLDNLLVYHRPEYHNDKTSTRAEVVSEKIKKQKENGMPGVTNFFYDRNTYRLRQESDEYHPFDDIKGL